MAENSALSFPKTLLVVGGDFRAKHAGEVFLRDGLRQVPRDRLVRYSLIEDPPEDAISSWEGFENIIDRHPSQKPNALIHRRPFRRIAPWLAHFAQRRFVIPRIAQRVQAQVRRLGIEKIIVVLDSPQLIYLARHLIRRGQGISALVWDPPERFVIDQAMSKSLAQMVFAEFEPVVRHCVSLATASDGMHDEYLNKYGKDSIVLIHGIEPGLHAPAAKSFHSEDGLSIGFAGSLYARSQWDALLQALAAADWEIAGRQVHIHILGRRLQIETSHPKTSIHYWGWRDLKETVRVLGEADIAYLPYWLNEKYRYICKMCFPNKISTYLAAGVPIFYHGPADGSPARFLEKYPAGIGCHSDDPAEIVKTLERFATEKDIFTKTVAAIEKARTEEYNLGVFENRCMAFLNTGTRRENNMLTSGRMPSP